PKSRDLRPTRQDSSEILRQGGYIEGNQRVSTGLRPVEAEEFGFEQQQQSLVGGCGHLRKLRLRPQAVANSAAKREQGFGGASTIDDKLVMASKDAAKDPATGSAQYRL